MVKIRNRERARSKVRAPSANGAQGSMNFIAGESWLATDRAKSESVASALLVELKASASRNRDANSFAAIASLSPKRSTSCRKNMVDVGPALCARQEPA